MPSYLCKISANSYRLQSTVLPIDPAGITTFNYDISDREIGSGLAILCPVDSCVEDLRVDLLRGGVVIDTRMGTDLGQGDTFAGTEAQFNLNVSQSLLGEYNCRVSGSFMGQPFAFDERFNITGNFTLFTSLTTLALLSSPLSFISSPLPKVLSSPSSLHLSNNPFFLRLSNTSLPL